MSQFYQLIRMLILSRQFLEYFILDPNYHPNDKMKNVNVYSFSN